VRAHAQAHFSRLTRVMRSAEQAARAGVPGAQLKAWWVLGRDARSVLSDGGSPAAGGSVSGAEVMASAPDWQSHSGGDTEDQDEEVLDAASLDLLAQVA
jgi:hypothetical protein